MFGVGVAGSGDFGIWNLVWAVASALVVVVLAVVLVVFVVLPARRSKQAPQTTGFRAVLDKALGQFASQPTQPPVYAAMVGPDRVSLRLSPVLPIAPPPWQARQDGAVWEAQNWQFNGGPQPAGTLPLLVSVGTVGGELAAVNLGRAQGIVALTGEATAANKLAASMLDEVSASGANITVVGPVPPSHVPADRMRIVGDIRRIPGLVTQPQPGDQHVTGARPTLNWLRNHLVVVTAPLSPEAAENLSVNAASSDNTAAVVVVGDVPTAAWRFASGANGSLNADVLGLQLDTHSGK
jgi:hypothetical protein